MRSSAAVFRGPGRLDLEERDVPVPGEGEVLIRVSACGVCGTDFHIFRGEAPARPPVVLGHEFCGEVVAVGDGVPDSDLRPGDRVAARGGCVLLFGVSPEELRVPVSPFDIYKRELRVQGSYVNPHTSSKAIALLASGAVNVDALVERIAPLEELPALLARGPSRDGAKVLVSPLQ